MTWKPLLPQGGTPIARPVLEPIAWWKILLGFMLGLLLAASATIAMLLFTTPGLSGKDLASARLDAIKVGLSIGIGLGGAFGLYLALRRQRATEADLDNRERALELQEQVAQTTAEDAAARRVTELYTKASEQLGSDKAPVRLGGLYAFERLAQENPDRPHLRQTVVNVICAYLRMPFTLPGDPPTDDECDRQTLNALLQDHKERVQEREVRLAAQRILATHLRPGSRSDNPDVSFWPDIDLDLTGATLIEWKLTNCHVAQARFDKATFAGPARFDITTFDRDARFSDATFTATANFVAAVFHSVAWFDHTTFGHNAKFDGASFQGETAVFDTATFDKDASFIGTTFASGPTFAGATFTRSTQFDHAEFQRHAPSFANSAFLDTASFTATSFFRPPDFSGANFSRGWPRELQEFTRNSVKSLPSPEPHNTDAS
ncbi:pentapeptide repeat-containing protein [Amycolatopsis keratiniphila]|uniref:pentapeptide repeat-containing protein n=1 Tax=Amycolatopsis keratiniphila TaxID=129921 RepID=UPI00039C7C28|nr:pentapeptide repeat-containing protein [Amycolatopsis keratiniphila]